MMTSAIGRPRSLAREIAATRGSFVMKCAFTRAKNQVGTLWRPQPTLKEGRSRQDHARNWGWPLPPSEIKRAPT
jgi:hypothetical protein